MNLGKGSLTLRDDKRVCTVKMSDESTLKVTR